MGSALRPDRTSHLLRLRSRSTLPLLEHDQSAAAPAQYTLYSNERTQIKSTGIWNEQRPPTWSRIIMSEEQEDLCMQRSIHKGRCETHSPGPPPHDRLVA